MTEPVTATYPIAGREVKLKLPTEAQYAMLGTLGNRITNTALPPADRLKAVGQLMAIMLSMVVKPEDRNFVEDKVINGELGLADFTEAIRAFGEDQTSKKTTVRRARTAKK